MMLCQLHQVLHVLYMPVGKIQSGFFSFNSVNHPPLGGDSQSCSTEIKLTVLLRENTQAYKMFALIVMKRILTNLLVYKYISSTGSKATQKCGCFI